MANTKIKNTVLDSSVISGQSTVTAASGDFVLIQDISDSDNLKKALVSDFGSELTGIDDQSSSNDDQLTITDSAVIINEDSDDVDFRVEGNGEANLLFVNAGDDRVGIGTASPASLLHIESATAPTIRIDDSDSTNALEIAQDGANGSVLLKSAGVLSIGVTNDSSSDEIAFKTRDTTRMTIDDSGQAEFKGSGNLVTFNASSGVTYVKFAENGTSRFFLATLNFSKSKTRKILRLRELAPSANIIFNFPEENDDSSLTSKVNLRTDNEGYILPYGSNDNKAIKILFLGGSTVESLRLEEKSRF